MARSVDYLTGAQAVAYVSGHNIEEWELFEEDIKYQLQELFPSLEECESWDGNETKVFLENGHAVVGISEYNGLVSVSLRAKEEGDWYDNQDGLHQAWVERVKDKFLTIGDLHKTGTFSNGEAMFETTGEDKHTYSSKEGLCEWLE